MDYFCLENLVTMWKKNGALIFQDSIKFNNFGDNFKLENRTLVISNVSANETADYKCSIPMSQTAEIAVTHHLYVQTSPEIISVKAPYGNVQVNIIILNYALILNIK